MLGGGGVTTGGRRGRPTAAARSRTQRRVGRDLDDVHLHAIAPARRARAVQVLRDQRRHIHDGAVDGVLDAHVGAVVVGLRDHALAVGGDLDARPAAVTLARRGVVPGPAAGVRPTRHDAVVRRGEPERGQEVVARGRDRRRGLTATAGQALLEREDARPGIVDVSRTSTSSDHGSQKSHPKRACGHDPGTLHAACPHPRSIVTRASRTSPGAREPRCKHECAAPPANDGSAGVHQPFTPRSTAPSRRRPDPPPPCADGAASDPPPRNRTRDTARWPRC